MIGIKQYGEDIKINSIDENTSIFSLALCKNMMRYSILVILIVLISCSRNTRHQDLPSIGQNDRIRIAEAFHIAENYCDEVWPGWGKVPLSLIFLTKDYEFLIHHPNPTPDFKFVGFDSLLNAEVLFRDRVFPEKLLAAFQAVNNESSILMGTPEITERSTSAWTITLLHEHFHQLQYFQPGYFEKSIALDLARGDSTAMWMLNFEFPYDDTEVTEQFRKLSEQLLELIQDRDMFNEEAIKNYLSNRESFRKLVGEENYRYMQFQLWQEGVALYTEWKLLEAILSSEFQLSPEFMELEDYISFESLQQQIYQRITRQLENMNMTQWKRVSFYAFGAGEALVLDHWKPGWRKHYLEHMFEMDKLWDL